MSNSSLIMAASLLVIPIIVSYKEDLNLGKEILICVLRAIIQLSIVGYLLTFVFEMENPIYMIILMLCMMLNASVNIKKRGIGIKNVVFVSFISIFIGSCITIGMLLICKAVAFVPNEIIPIGGMIISNCMVSIGMSYRNLNSDFKNKRCEVEVKLSLGSDINMASKSIIRDSIKSSIMPSIDSAKALGIVSLPGTMTGLILAGASPILAIKYQLMVTFMVLASSSISSMVATYISYKSFFNDRKQLI